MKTKVLVVSLATLVGGGLLWFLNPSTSANSVDSQLNLQIASILALSVDSCNVTDPTGQTNIYITPNAGGNSQSNQCQNVSISTNASGGYELSIETSSSTLNHNPALTLQATIPSTSTTPATLTSDTWGFAIPKTNNDGKQPNSANLISAFVTNFDSTYAAESNLPASTAKYRSVPLSTTKFAETDTYSGGTDDYTLYFGANVPGNKPSGIYQTTITYTGTAIDLMPTTYCGTQDFECIIFTIETSDGNYRIPTSGSLNWTSHTFDWEVYVDGVPTISCDVSCGQGMYGDDQGQLLHEDVTGRHQIKILPHGEPIPGWGNAFGHGYSGIGANTQANKDKIVSIDAPLTTMAFAPKPSESTTEASAMFSSLFNSCTNLTTPARFIDTYKLPDTITDLSFFMMSTHEHNDSLISSVDLSSLDGWLYDNSSITDLSFFLEYTHIGFTPEQHPSIVDSPVKLPAWFNSNNSIVDLSGFLLQTHYGSINLTNPIDLTPLAGWFDTNSSIELVTDFLLETHKDNPSLLDPIDLTPLSGWFNDNRSFGDWGLFGFLRSTHYNNPNLMLNGQTILPNWIKTATQNGTPIWDINNPYTNASNTFTNMFHTLSAQGGDTGEPKFQDGTVLSSLGQPSTNRSTYTNRAGITPVNSNWK